MTTQVQIRGATQVTQEARTLATRELDVNTTDVRLAIHDGSTAGGIPHVNFKDQQNQEFIYGAASGTDTITMSCARAPGAYQAGQTFVFKAAATNTGSATLNVDSLGAKTIKKKDISGGALANVAAGDIISGGMYRCYYDGTYMQIELGGGAAGGGDTIVYSATASADASLGSTGIFTSGYSYEIEVTDFTPATDGRFLCFETHDGTSYDTTLTDYDSNVVVADGGSVSGTFTGSGTPIGLQLTSAVGSAANESASGIIHVHNPAQSGEWTKITWDFSITDTGGGIQRNSGSAQLDVRTTATTGFRLRFYNGSADDIESGTITVREKALS